MVHVHDGAFGAPTEVRVRLARAEERSEHWSGGSVTYRVYLNGRWVGWVGDARSWRGHRYGGRRWWACWRTDGDVAARASSKAVFSSQPVALAWLLDVAAYGDTLSTGGAA